MVTPSRCALPGTARSFCFSLIFPSKQGLRRALRGVAMRRWDMWTVSDRPALQAHRAIQLPRRQFVKRLVILIDVLGLEGGSVRALFKTEAGGPTLVLGMRNADCIST